VARIGDAGFENGGIALAVCRPDPATSVDGHEQSGDGHELSIADHELSIADHERSVGDYE